MSMEGGLDENNSNKGTKNTVINSPPTAISYWNLAWTEAAGGAVAGGLADGVLYGIDSAKVRSQTAPVAGTAGTSAGGVRILFQGLGPTILLGSVPSLGGFFLLYAPCKRVLQERNAELLLPIASGVCAIPATILAVPADVVKKRLVLGMNPTVMSAVREVVARDGIYRGLFAGWHINLVKDIPFAGIKIGLYEAIVPLYQKHMQQYPEQELTTMGATVCGLVSGIGCAILTAPLDVINTRIKADDKAIHHSTSIRAVSRDIVQQEGVSALFRGVVMRSFVLGVGSSIFWPIQRTISISLQQG